MAVLGRRRNRKRSTDHTTEAEDAALLLALVICGILGMTVVFLVILEFFEILPGDLDTIAFVSLLVFAAVVGRALISRALAIPSIYRGRATRLRYIGR